MEYWSLHHGSIFRDYDLFSAVKTDTLRPASPSKGAEFNAESQ